MSDSNKESYQTEFVTENSLLPTYMIFPRFILDCGLSETAVLEYVLLLDRTRLSLTREGWADRCGHTFVYFSIDNLAKALHKSRTTIAAGLSELEKKNLIIKVRQGLGKPNRVYVKLPTQTQEKMWGNLLASGSDSNHPDDQNPAFQNTRFKTSGISEIDTSDNRGLDASKNYSSKNKTIKPIHQKEESEVPSAYGMYQNVILSKEELKALQREYPHDWLKWIEKLSEYMSSTGKEYRNHLATIRHWANKEAEKSLPRPYVYDRFPRCEEDSL